MIGAIIVIHNGAEGFVVGITGSVIISIRRQKTCPRCPPHPLGEGQSKFVTGFFVKELSSADPRRSRFMGQFALHHPSDAAGVGGKGWSVGQTAVGLELIGGKNTGQHRSGGQGKSSAQAAAIAARAGMTVWKNIKSQNDNQAIAGITNQTSRHPVWQISVGLSFHWVSIAMIQGCLKASDGPSFWEQLKAYFSHTATYYSITFALCIFLGVVFGHMSVSMKRSVSAQGGSCPSR